LSEWTVEATVIERARAIGPIGKARAAAVRMPRDRVEESCLEVNAVDPCHQSFADRDTIWFRLVAVDEDAPGCAETIDVGADEVELGLAPDRSARPPDEGSLGRIHGDRRDLGCRRER
jgi:hypothetical protein